MWRWSHRRCRDTNEEEGEKVVIKALLYNSPVNHSTKNALHVLKTLLPVAAPSHAASCAPVVNICVLNQDLIGGEEAGVAWHGEWRVACLNL